MQTDELISIREYLSTSFRPDCDYVDGVVVERNMGEYDHARLQMAVSGYFYARRKELGIEVVPEQRVQVSATRFRVPDVCVILAGSEPGQIFTTPPFICIEILSRDDRLTAMYERVKDYLAFGVPYVWILNPSSRTAHRCTAEGLLETQELRTENPDILLPLAALFE
jgi:Uma2 family endonuclease